MLRNIALFFVIREEQSLGAHRLWRCINTLCSHLKHVLSRNFDQNKLKNALFLKKLEKSPQSPRPELLSPSFVTVAFLNTFAALTCALFIVEKEQKYHSRCFAF